MKAHLKRYFITGLLVTVPLSITIYVLGLVVGVMDAILTYLPKPLQPDTYLPFHIPGLGVIFTILAILLTGLLATNLLGRRFIEAGERFLDKIPFLRSVYNSTKQFLEAFLSREHQGFRRVVLVEFPRKGLYSVGFITGVTKGEVQDKTREKVVNVFLPTTPNPTTGYYLLVPEKDIIYLDMSIEDAFKLIITGGMVTPESGFTPGDKTL
ncbi:MAG: DUF502 domain-containing protein [Deltaproteobacteria bacterium]|nr:DUF502 domain-containing protein [Deltaproteobacteria bacterium]